MEVTGEPLETEKFLGMLYPTAGGCTSQLCLDLGQNKKRNLCFYLLNLLAKNCWCYTETGIQMTFAWKFGQEREGCYVYAV